MKTPVFDEEIRQAIRKYRYDPVAFVVEVLKAKPDAWQELVLLELAESQRVAIQAGHSVGKSAFESWSINWFLFTRPDCRIVATAPTQNHLFGVLWAECNKWLSKSPVMDKYFSWQKTRIVYKDNPANWFAMAKTASKSEGMAGTHQDEEFSGVFIVVDEASGVDDGVIEALEGSITNEDCKMLLCGNPVRSTGYFRDCFTKDTRFKCYTVSCLNQKLVTRDTDARIEYAKGMALKWGEDSNVYRIRVLGLPPRTEDDAFISIDLYNSSVYKQNSDTEPKIEGDIQLGVDVAKGGEYGDSSVIAPRVGKFLLPVWEKKVLGEDGIMVIAEKAFSMAINLMNQYDQETCVIAVDDNGIGTGTADRLIQLVGTSEYKNRITVVKCNFWNSVDKDLEKIQKDKDKGNHIPYDKWGDQMWGYFKDKLAAGELVFYKYDADVEGQLTTRRFGVPYGKIKLESKRDMKKRKVSSPDKADAIVLSCVPTQIENQNPFINKSLQQDEGFQKYIEELKRLGIYKGYSL